MEGRADIAGRIDVQQWLKSNKLPNSSILEKLQSKSITIEEISELSDDELKRFLQETLKLDILQTKRFIKGITFLQKEQSSPRLPLHKIIISEQEQQGLKKLYHALDRSSKLQMNIQSVLTIATPNGVHQNSIQCEETIHQTFDDIIKRLSERKALLMHDIDRIVSHKSELLKHQTNALQNEYIPLIQSAKHQYESHTNGVHSNLNILDMVGNVLAYNAVATTTFMTEPTIKYDTHQSMANMDTFLNALAINDCDVPNVPTFTVSNVTSCSVSVRYDIDKEYYKTIHKPLAQLSIEYALLPKNVALNENVADTDSKTGTDSSNSSSESSSDSAADSNDSAAAFTSPNTALASKSSDSGMDFEVFGDCDRIEVDKYALDGVLQTAPMQKVVPIKTAKKTKSERKKRKRKHKPKAQKTIFKSRTFSDIDAIDTNITGSVKWSTEEMHKISKSKPKKTDKKCVINGLKPERFYIVRMRLLNESGWSDYSPIVMIQTLPIVIRSKILKAKEQIKLKQMVDEHSKYRYRKEWKLLFRGSKNGFGSNDFFNKCHGKRNTLCVIQSDINNVFGGFTTVPWDRNITGFGTLSDAHAFLYTIRSSNKFPASIFGINPAEINGAIGHQTHYYLMFGSGANGLYISDKCNTNRTSTVRSSCSTYLMPQGSILNGGVSTFQVVDIEVFQLR